MGFSVKASYRKISPNISLFCNINEAVPDGEKFNIHQQVIHISSTNGRSQSRCGFTGFSRQIHTKAFQPTFAVNALIYITLEKFKEWIVAKEFKTFQSPDSHRSESIYQLFHIIVDTGESNFEEQKK